MAASNAAMIQDIALNANLQLQIKAYNNPIGRATLSSLPNFNGAAADCYDFIEQLQLIAGSNSWPTGLIGTNINGPHHDGGAAAVIAAAWNNHANWACTTQAIRVAVAAGGGGAGISQLPAHPNITWTNHELDGFQVISGAVITANDGIDAARTTRSIITGRWHLVGGITTNQFQPINDCRRSRAIIDFCVQRFTDQARRLWNDTPDADRPRTLEDHRWEGQNALPGAMGNEGYGFYSWLRRNFISERFKEAKFHELQTLTYLNYPTSISKLTNREEPRNMAEFIRYYKMGLTISETNFGTLLNQRVEFFKRIDRKIIEEIMRWMATPGNQQPTMEQIYLQAQRFEVNYIGTRAFEQIAPLTTRNSGTRERGRSRYQRNYYSNNN